MEQSLFEFFVNIGKEILVLGGETFEKSEKSDDLPGAEEDDVTSSLPMATVSGNETFT